MRWDCAFYLLKPFLFHCFVHSLRSFKSVCTYMQKKIKYSVPVPSWGRKIRVKNMSFSDGFMVTDKNRLIWDPIMTLLHMTYHDTKRSSRMDERDLTLAYVDSVGRVLREHKHFWMIKCKKKQLAHSIEKGSVCQVLLKKVISKLCRSSACWINSFSILVKQQD